MLLRELHIRTKQGRCIWYNGKDVYEVSFCNEFLEEHPMKFVDGKFYNTDGAVDIQTVRKMISDKLLAEQVQKDFAKRVNALTGALQSICYAPDFEGGTDEIHLLNGVLTTDMEFRPDELKICKNRLNVCYNPTAPEPERWLAFLNDLLEPEDIKTFPSMMKKTLEQFCSGDSNIYFLTGKAKPTEPRTYRQYFKRFLKRNGLKAMKSHELRHTFAIRAIEQPEFDLKTLSEILGHKNVSFTLNVYGRSNMSHKSKCMNLLNDLL